MPDINLPGVSSNINVKELIDGLVKVESKKLDRLESAKDKFDKEKSAWVSLGNKIKALEESSKQLYGFRSPFENKVAVSSDESILVAEAQRTAEPSRSMVRVEQLARNERILSDPIPDDLVLDKQRIVFRVGEAEADIHFEGGRISDLVRAINEQGKDLIFAKSTKDTEGTSVLVIESKETGESNGITVRDEDSLSFLKKIGLFETREIVTVDTGLTEKNVTAITEKGTYTVKDGILLLEPGTEAALTFDTAVEAKEGILIRVEVSASDIAKEKVEPKVVSWPELKRIGSVTVRDIVIDGGRSISAIEEEKKPVEEKKPQVQDDRVFGVLDSRGKRYLIEPRGIEEEFKGLEFGLTEVVPAGTKITGFVFVNNNTEKRVAYRQPTLEDTKERGGVVPKHLVQEAKDSIIHIDDVRVRRNNNEIEDAVGGVTLRLVGEGEKKVSITVDRDFELITGKIIDVIEKYNDLMKFINDGMKVVPSGTLDEETESGILTGDITVQGLKTRLQNIMMNPYPTSLGKELSLLAQVGVSMGAHGTSWSDIKGGYLQVEEGRFIEALRTHPKEIEELFGSDTNRDMVTDNGVAYTLERNMKGYTDPQSGIVSYHIKNTDSDIKSQEKKIEDWKEHLEEYRKKLESDFTLMQQALHEMEQSQKSLENFSKQFSTK
ncbi:MAG: flagellar filament capping protein FliD [Spirochaetes bacterium]|nr:flagellar filament capping protein FliD [Spirochaetota bacterium]